LELGLHRLGHRGDVSVGRADTVRLPKRPDLVLAWSERPPTGGPVAIIAVELLPNDDIQSELAIMQQAGL